MSSFGLVRVLDLKGKITTQDLGRKGWLHLGVCESGAADELAFLWANHLLGNAVNVPTLEIILGQVTLEFTVPTIAALTGADVAGRLNDKPVVSGQSFQVAAGDVLRLSIPKKGIVNYLAVLGGFRVHKVCGSASICEREKMGPFKGAPLSAGDCIGYHALAQTIPLRNILRDWNVCLSREDIPVIVTTPPSDVLKERKAKEQTLVKNTLINTLLKQRFCISTETNRMGCRLQGEPLDMGSLPVHRASAGVPYGAIQVPPDGQPIVLLKDRQTMGGYPVVACLSRLGAGRLAQCRPGDWVSFSAVTIEQARQQWRAWSDFFQARQ